MRWRPLRTALVLGGGGARGMAHVGVLDVLREAKFQPDLIVGTSMGAIAGAAYALDPGAATLSARFVELCNESSVLRVERRFSALIGEARQAGWRGRISGLVGNVRKLIVWNRHAMAQSLVDGMILSEMIDRLIDHAHFDATRIPFYAVTFDLNQGSDVVIGSGDMGLALRASSAIPGVLAPVCVDGRLLVDGSVFQELPTPIARRLGADFVIAVDVGREVDPRAPSSSAEVVQRVLHHRGDRIRRENRALADVVISPGVAGVHWSEFSRAAWCIGEGAAATHAALDTIRHRMQEVRRRTLFRRLRAPRQTGRVTAIGVGLPEAAR